MSGTPATPEVDETENITNRPDETAGIEDNSIPGEDEIQLDDSGIYDISKRSVLTPEQIRVLGANRINPARVMKRDGNSYLQAWDVKATLIKVFGWGGFSTEVLKAEIIQIREHAAGSVGHVVRKKTQYADVGDPKTPQVIAQVTMRLTLHNIGPTVQRL